MPVSRALGLNQLTSPAAAREPMLRVLLDELDKETAQTTELIATLAQRLDPILEVVPDVPPSPTVDTPRPQLAQALESLRQKIDRVKGHNRVLIDIRYRLEV